MFVVQLQLKVLLLQHHQLKMVKATIIMLEIFDSHATFKDSV